jgi:hypothetical protein
MRIPSGKEIVILGIKDNGMEYEFIFLSSVTTHMLDWNWIKITKSPMHFFFSSY